MTEQVRLDNEELQAVVAEWGAAVPPAVAHPPIPPGLTAWPGPVAVRVRF
jgi:hypothetical protein